MLPTILPCLRSGPTPAVFDHFHVPNLLQQHMPESNILHISEKPQCGFVRRCAAAEQLLDALRSRASPELTSTEPRLCPMDPGSLTGVDTPDVSCSSPATSSVGVVTDVSGQVNSDAFFDLRKQEGEEKEESSCLPAKRAYNPVLACAAAAASRSGMCSELHSAWDFTRYADRIRQLESANWRLHKEGQTMAARHDQLKELNVRLVNSLQQVRWDRISDGTCHFSHQHIPVFHSSWMNHTTLHLHLHVLLLHTTLTIYTYITNSTTFTQTTDLVQRVERLLCHECPALPRAFVTIDLLDLIQHPQMRGMSRISCNGL